MFTFALVAISCVMVESELLWSEMQESDQQMLLVTPQTANRSSSGGPSVTRAIAFSQGFVALKCVLSAATLALVGALVMRYRTLSLPSSR